MTEIKTIQDYIAESMALLAGYMYGCSGVGVGIAGCLYSDSLPASVAFYFLGGVVVIMTLNRHRRLCEWMEQPSGHSTTDAVEKEPGR